MKKILHMLLFMTVFCLASFWVSYASAATSNVVKIDFTTEERSVDPDVLSEALTIQAQNNSGEEEKLDGTADVTFTSSSATGEFLGSTGKAITKTMNSGSANKTFYYKDSTEGKHTITTTVIPRTGGTGWPAQQKVYVGVAAENAEDTGDAEETADSSGSDTGFTGASSNSGSHSGTAKLSQFTKSPSLKVGAGRNRTVLTNTPIRFQAESNQVSKKVAPKLKYKWSFGDGDSEIGEKVNHVYYFPGEYNVILTAQYRDEVAVSRMKVKVVDSLVTVASTSPGLYGFIELQNNSSSEVNVNDWEIRSNDRQYVISVDTIINAKSSVRIPNRIMHFEPSSRVQLMFPTEEIAYVYDQEKEVERQLQKQIALAKPVTSTIEPLSKDITAELTVEEPVASKIGQTESKINYATSVQAAAVALPKDSWWAYVKSFFSLE